MKKLFFAAFALACSYVGFAQTAPKPAPAKVQAVKTAPTTKVVTTTTTTPVVKAKPVAATAAVPLKKDGTPDKRFKAAQKPAGPVKKDGTADMRYKANKKH